MSRPHYPAVRRRLHDALWMANLAAGRRLLVESLQQHGNSTSWNLGKKEGHSEPRAPHSPKLSSCRVPLSQGDLASSRPLLQGTRKRVQTYCVAAGPDEDGRPGVTIGQEDF